jgi:hypothetical protein
MLFPQPRHLPYTRQIQPPIFFVNPDQRPSRADPAFPLEKLPKAAAYCEDATMPGQHSHPANNRKTRKHTTSSPVNLWLKVEGKAVSAFWKRCGRIVRLANGSSIRKVEGGRIEEGSANRTLARCRTKCNSHVSFATIHFNVQYAQLAVITPKSTSFFDRRLSRHRTCPKAGAHTAER